MCTCIIDTSVPFIITGDFNARIGNLQDFNEGIESLKNVFVLMTLRKIMKVS